jgi:hypothetical protein
MKTTIAIVTIVAAAVTFGALFAPPASAAAAPGVEKASVGGKYTDLLETIDIPQDAVKYGNFYELGFQTRTTYGGHTNEPPEGILGLRKAVLVHLEDEGRRYRRLAGLHKGFHEREVRDGPKDVFRARR